MKLDRIDKCLEYQGRIVDAWVSMKCLPAYVPWYRETLEEMSDKDLSDIEDKLLVEAAYLERMAKEWLEQASKL